MSLGPRARVITLKTENHMEKKMEHETYVGVSRDDCPPIFLSQLRYNDGTGYLK